MAEIGTVGGPITNINAIIPINFYSNRHYIPFWLLTLSKFLLFLTHNMIQNMSITILGKSGSIAMTILYIFFIGGNFIAPKLLDMVGHNAGLLMFYTSIIYTIFAFATTGVVVGLNPTDTSHKMLFSQEFIHNAFFVASAIVGLAGGAIWVGYGILNIELGDKISKAILDDVVRAEQQKTGQLEIELSGDDLVTIDNNSYTYSQLLQPLVETITGKIMSIGWSLLSLNTAIGGILGYLVLSGHTSTTTPSTARLELLFIIFSLISCAANASYFALYKYTTDNNNNNNSMNMTTTNGNNNNNNGNDLFEKESYLSDTTAIREEKCSLLSGSPQYGSINNFQDDNDDDDDQEAQSNDSGRISGNSIQQQQQQQSYNIFYNYSQWELFTLLMRTPYILLSLIQYIAAGMSFNFIFASFSAYTVAPLLGLESVALVIIIAEIASTIASFFIGTFIATHLNARRWSIIGSIIQLLPPLLPLFVEFNNINNTTTTSKYDIWAFVITLSTFGGIGDAIMSSSLTTTMASDIKYDIKLQELGYFGYSLDGQTTTTNEKIFRDIKSIVYSIYSATKSVGVFFVFFLGGFATYFQQCLITSLLICSSIIVQFVLYQRLKFLYPTY